MIAYEIVKESTIAALTAGAATAAKSPVFVASITAKLEKVLDVSSTLTQKIVQKITKTSIKKPTMVWTGARYQRRSDWAEQAYDSIRALKRSDIETIAKNTGLSVDDVTTVKKHLFFGKHNNIPKDAPDQAVWTRRRFGADESTAFAWQQAMKGELSDEGKDWMRRLADHEIAERRFMIEGHDYRHIDSYIPENQMYDRIPPGAHDLAPPAPLPEKFPGFREFNDKFLETLPDDD